jgi:S-adenosylmethionine:diacylglycerol 3-amino-3-carboxypropyl transferase
MESFWRTGQLGKGAKKKPEIVFGQVREDPSAELLARGRVQQSARIFSIASGGCTAFALLATEPESLIACDINPAQCMLVELKKTVLEQLDDDSIRCAFLVSAQSAFFKVRSLLSLRTQQFWDSRIALLSDGLNSCGIVDRQMIRAMRLFRLFIHNESIIRQMLDSDDLRRQTEFYSKQWKSWRWKFGFWLLSDITLLRSVYGKEVLEKLPRDFACHIYAQVNSSFTGSVSRNNPYLWQTFMPHIPPPTNEQLPFHLQTSNLAACRRALPRLTCITGDAVQVISDLKDQNLDLAFLSNILEFASPDYVARLAEALAQKMKSGGIVLMRFFFPPSQQLLDVLSKWFVSEAKLSFACAQADRGLFCKNIFAYLRQSKI